MPTGKQLSNPTFTRKLDSETKIQKQSGLTLPTRDLSVEVFYAPGMSAGFGGWRPASIPANGFVSMQ